MIDKRMRYGVRRGQLSWGKKTHIECKTEIQKERVKFYRRK